MIRKLKVPHTLVLLYGMIVLAYVLTLLLPAGRFETETSHGHEVVVPGTYAVIEDAPRLSLTELFTVIPRGLGDAQGIIFFVFLIGGARAVIRASGALDTALARILNRFGSGRYEDRLFRRFTRHQLVEPLGKPHGRVIGRNHDTGMTETFYLVFNRRNHLRIRMTGIANSDARTEVDVTLAFNIPDFGIFSPLYVHGRGIALPARERGFFALLPGVVCCHRYFSRLPKQMNFTSTYSSMPWRVS